VTTRTRIGAGRVTVRTSLGLALAVCLGCAVRKLPPPPPPVGGPGTIGTEVRDPSEAALARPISPRAPAAC
jgi:hypothetical protein